MNTIAILARIYGKDHTEKRDVGYFCDLALKWMNIIAILARIYGKDHTCSGFCGRVYLVCSVLQVLPGE